VSIVWIIEGGEIGRRLRCESLFLNVFLNIFVVFEKAPRIEWWIEDPADKYSYMPVRYRWRSVFVDCRGMNRLSTSVY